MNFGFATAAIFSLITAGLHVFVGGATSAKPLLHSDLHPVPKFTNYYCWHITTIVILTMSGGFAYAARFPDGRDVAVLCTLLAAAFTLWSLLLVAWKYRRPWRLPQWALFLAISVAAIAGLV